MELAGSDCLFLDELDPGRWVSRILLLRRLFRLCAIRIELVKNGNIAGDSCKDDNQISQVDRDINFIQQIYQLMAGPAKVVKE